MKSYLFTVRKPPFEEVSIDTWFEIPERDEEMMEEMNHYLKIAKIRTKVHGDMPEWVYLVKTEGEMTPEDMEILLRGKDLEGELKEWLDEAQFYQTG